MENTDGAKRTRTADPLHAMQVLYQLSYSPIIFKDRSINFFWFYLCCPWVLYYFKEFY